MSISYIVLVAVTLAIGFGASAYVNSQIKKYSKVPISNGLSGAEAAQKMLQDNGLYDIPIKRGSAGQDFYDPRSRSITLDPEAYSGRSITATATACHEAGHAIQHAQKYTPLIIRSAIVPVVNIASNAWIFLLIAGIALNIAGLIDAAIIMYLCAVAFQIITLPVEFNASKRAMAYMQHMGLPQSEQGGAFSVLRACALTYVAAALTSILQLLYLLAQRD